MGNRKSRKCSFITEPRPTDSMKSVSSVSSSQAQLLDAALPEEPVEMTFSYRSLFSRYYNPEVNWIAQNQTIDPIVLKDITEIFEKLKHDVTAFNNFYSHILDLDENFLSKFEYIDDIYVGSFSQEDHDAKTIIEAHYNSFIILHIKLLEAFKESNDKACEILEMVSLSHFLKDINNRDFKTFDQTFGKHLIDMGLVTENNQRNVIIYFGVILYWLLDYSKKILQPKSLKKSSRSYARENYSKVIKWREFRKNVKQDVEEMVQSRLPLSYPSSTAHSFDMLP